MSAELDALWRLSELDERVLAAREKLAKYPEQRRALESRASGEKARLEAHKQSVADLQKKRRDLEREIESVTQTQRKYEAQQPSVKTNDEYQALSHQINGCKDKRSELETQVLMQMEAEDRLASERPAIEAALKRAEGERDAQAALVAREEAVENEALAAIEAQRGEAMAALAPATRSRYERIHGSKDGRAVVALVKNACGGCFRSQPPQVIQEAKKRDRVLLCDGCGRILLFPPGAAA